MKFLQNSMTNYKVLKKQFIEDNFKSDIEKETKLIEKKENELIFLKKCHEKKSKDKNFRTSNIIFPVKKEKIDVNEEAKKKYYFQIKLFNLYFRKFKGNYLLRSFLYL